MLRRENRARLVTYLPRDSINCLKFSYCRRCFYVPLSLFLCLWSCLIRSRHRWYFNTSYFLFLCCTQTLGAQTCRLDHRRKNWPRLLPVGQHLVFPSPQPRSASRTWSLRKPVLKAKPSPTCSVCHCVAKLSSPKAIFGNCAMRHFSLLLSTTCRPLSSNVYIY